MSRANDDFELRKDSQISIIVRSRPGVSLGDPSVSYLFRNALLNSVEIVGPINEDIAHQQLGLSQNVAGTKAVRGTYCAFILLSGAS